MAVSSTRSTFRSKRVSKSSQTIPRARRKEEWTSHQPQPLKQPPTKPITNKTAATNPNNQHPKSQPIIQITKITVQTIPRARHKEEGVPPPTKPQPPTQTTNTQNHSSDNSPRPAQGRGGPPPTKPQPPTQTTNTQNHSPSLKSKTSQFKHPPQPVDQRAQQPPIYNLTHQIGAVSSVG